MKSQSDSIKTLGIIAGGGALPAKLLDACSQKEIDTFVVGFDGQTDPLLMKGHNYLWTRLGAAGNILRTLKAHDIRDIVLIGSIRRPTLGELYPDFKTLEFFTRVGMRALGDNDLLKNLRELLEEEGFKIHGVQEFIEDLLTPEGKIGRYEPKKGDWVDIRRGIDVALMLGESDVGQSVIVQEGIVLGVEAVEGTDSLIDRCTKLKRKGRGGVLVKLCKPQQDKDLDLPTIGPTTLEQAALAGLAGIAVHARESLMIDPQQVAEIANDHKIFVIGVNPKDYT